MLVFDGDCGFCTSCANWVASRWRGDARAVAWQRLSPAELAGLGLTEADARGAAWWIDETGERFRGHLAIALSLVAGRGWSKYAGVLLLVPPFRWVAAAAYPLVARYRHLLPGGTPACRP